MGAATTEELDLSLLNPILEEFKGDKVPVISILQRAQKVYGYLPRPVLREISRRTKVPISQLFGVATFYAQFHLKRRGRHIARVCDGTACHVRGAPKNIAAVEHSLKLSAGETTPDYRVTLEIVYCLGSCGLAPVAVVDDKVHGLLTPDRLVNHLKELK